MCPRFTTLGGWWSADVGCDNLLIVRVMDRINPAFGFSFWEGVDAENAFGMTAKEWRDANPLQQGNIRDYASINELICLSNMENLNAVFIEEVPQN